MFEQINSHTVQGETYGVEKSEEDILVNIGV